MAKQSIRLYKYHSLGNDFLLCESSEAGLSKLKIGKLASKWCHRHTGIGADGLLWLRSSTLESADIRVDVFNSDGSWAERSGNGQRIVGVHLKHQSKGKRNEFSIETSVGLARVEVRVGTKAIQSTAYMATPDFQTSSLPMRGTTDRLIRAPLRVGDVTLDVTCVSVGNPHVVVHLRKPLKNWRTLGSLIEHDKRFPNRTNVEFVQVLSPKLLQVLVWERGAGETGSSGTGAAASLAAMVAAGESSRSVRINFPAGQMKASWLSDRSEISTSAPVELVGVIEVPR